MKTLLAAVLLTACTAHASTLPPLFVADTALGGQIILQPTMRCEPPFQEWRHFVVTRADGLVVESGCWRMSPDQTMIVAREGRTLYPITWPITSFKELVPRR